MHTTTDTAKRPIAAGALTDRLRAARRVVVDLDDFRRVNYADGWDDDDADLGWVDEEIVRARPRRLH